MNRRILAAVMLILLGMVGALMLRGTTEAQAIQSLRLEVTALDGATFDTSGLPAGAFSVEGTFLGPIQTVSTVDGGTRQVQGTGQFYRSGTKLPSGVVVTQDSYVSRDYNGALYVLGVIDPQLDEHISGDTLLAVVGGIGTFKGANGDVAITPRSDGSFRAVWRNGKGK